MTRKISSTAQVFALAMFIALALSCAQAGDFPKNYILVNRSDVSEMRIDEEVNGEYVPAAPKTEDLISADPPCEEMLEMANHLNVTPAGIYGKIQPFQQEKRPLTPGGKFKLAIVNTVDPFNMAMEAADAATSAWTVSPVGARSSRSRFRWRTRRSRPRPTTRPFRSVAPLGCCSSTTSRRCSAR